MSDLATANIAKLHSLIQLGALSAAKVLEKVQNELPSDTIAPTGKITFGASRGNVIAKIDGRDMMLHRHAVGHLATEANVPQKFMSHFLDVGQAPWGADMVADVLERTFRNGVKADKRLLVRHVAKGDTCEARAFLSDRYRRLDSGILVEAFVEAIKGTGIMPYEGMASDTRFTIQCIKDKLYYAGPGEAHAYGIAFGHSDYGDGALELRGFMMRLACTNGMMAKNHMRQIHIGTKLSDDVTWSDKTFRADSELSASKIRDVVAGVMSDKVIEMEFSKLTQAYEEKIDPKKAAESAAKALGSKETAAAVADAFNGADVENMPAGHTRARWANAISWVANAQTDAKKKLDLQGYAAEVAGLVAPGGGRTVASAEALLAVAAAPWCF